MRHQISLSPTRPSHTSRYVVTQLCIFLLLQEPEFRIALLHEDKNRIRVCTIYDRCSKTTSVLVCRPFIPFLCTLPLTLFCASYSFGTFYLSRLVRPAFQALCSYPNTQSIHGFPRQFLIQYVLPPLFLPPTSLSLFLGFRSG